MKKLKLRRVLSALLSTSLVLAISAPSIFAVAAENVSFEEIEAMIDEQRYAVAAGELLNGAFESDSSESGYKYPDTYGGMYIAGDKLHVQLVDATEDSYEFYNTLLGDYLNWVEYETVDYSYNDLYEACEKMADYLSEAHAVSNYYVDVKMNQGVVSVEADSYTQVCTQTNNNSMNEMVRIEPESVAQPAVDLIGGTGISINGSGYSFGYCGTYYGGGGVDFRSGFVLCGHFISVGDVILQNGTTIGTVRHVQCANNGYGDYALAECSTGVKMTNKVKINGDTRTITAAVSNPVVGTTVYYYGNRTGYGYGTIDKTGVTTSMNMGTYNLDIKGMTSVVPVYGSKVNHGDSGGPWYTKNGNGAWAFCGVTSGYGESCSFFTPYYYFSGKFIPLTS